MSDSLSFSSGFTRLLFSYFHLFIRTQSCCSAFLCDTSDIQYIFLSHDQPSRKHRLKPWKPRITDRARIVDARQSERAAVNRCAERTRPCKRDFFRPSLHCTNVRSEEPFSQKEVFDAYAGVIKIFASRRAGIPATNIPLDCTVSMQEPAPCGGAKPQDDMATVKQEPGMFAVWIMVVVVEPIISAGGCGCDRRRP